MKKEILINLFIFLSLIAYAVTMLIAGQTKVLCISIVMLTASIIIATIIIMLIVAKIIINKEEVYKN